jgi:hypothetical protein
MASGLHLNNFIFREDFVIFQQHYSGFQSIPTSSCSIDSIRFDDPLIQKANNPKKSFRDIFADPAANLQRE